MAAIVIIPVRVVEVSLLPRGTGQERVRRNRPQSEVVTKDALEYGTNERMLHHWCEDGALVEHVPDAFLILLSSRREMRRFLRLSGNELKQSITRAHSVLPRESP